MDCTPFIRTKTLMTAWLGLPLLLVLLMEFGSEEYYNQQRTSWEQKKTVSRMAPQLQREADNAKQFLKTYSINLGSEASAEDACITLINNAANQSNFMVSSINLDQKTIDPSLATAMMTIHLKGAGTSRQIAGFVKTLKSDDPFIFESSLLVTPEGFRRDALRVDATFIRVYVE
jgi:hypothetical protein